MIETWKKQKSNHLAEGYPGDTGTPTGLEDATSAAGARERRRAGGATNDAPTGRRSSPPAAASEKSEVYRPRGPSRCLGDT